MKTMKLLVVSALALALLGISACAQVKDSHELSVLYKQGQLMEYESAAEGVSKDGRTLIKSTLVGKALQPATKTTTKDVLVSTPALAPAAPPRPVYGREAKAIPRTPPVCPPGTKDVVKRLTETTTTDKGAEVLSTASEGGLTGAVEITKATLNALASVGASYFAPGTKINMSMTGANALANAANSNKINQQQWSEMTAVQQQATLNNLIASSSSSSSAAAAAAAKVPGGK